MPNYLNTSFVNKLCSIFRKTNFEYLYSMASNQNTHAKASFWLQQMNLFKILKARHKTDVVVLDFSKAFDVAPHQRLLHKLDHYGIRGATLHWIQNFLTKWTQNVVVDGCSSESARMRSSVPQGTVLGPLLFLTYINDLPSTVSSQVRLFADDCLLYRPIECRADQRSCIESYLCYRTW